MPVGRTCWKGHHLAGRVEGDRLRPFGPEGMSMLKALSTSTVSNALPAPDQTVTFEPTLPIDWTATLRDCVGFLDHVRNTRRSRGVTDQLPKTWFERPAFYFANPASLRGWDEPIAVPAESERFDLEFEIAAVLGAGGENLSSDEAGRCIAGYVLYCDWSARDIQSDERTMQIGQGKGKDGAISLGPWILTADEASEFRREDGFDIDVSVTINDDRLLARPFIGMDWTFEELVAYASYGAGVRAGDLVASGTVPGGCLLEHFGTADFPGWLRAGDRVELDGGPLGRISTTIAHGVPAVSWRRQQSHEHSSTH